MALRQGRYEPGLVSDEENKEGWQITAHFGKIFSSLPFLACPLLKHPIKKKTRLNAQEVYC